MKGIGIILMVMGHDGFPFTHWIFLFHMALFFIISGYCWNDKYAESADNLKQLFKKRLITLYVPYVICNIIFLLLTNTFLNMSIYTDNPEFIAALGDNIGNNKLIEPMTPLLIAKNIVAILVLHGNTQLGGPTWFFGVLFIVTIGHGVLSFLSCKMGINKNIVYIGVFVLFSIYMKLSMVGIVRAPLNDIILRIVLAYMTFLIGIALKYLIAKYQGSFKQVYVVIVFLFSFTVLLIMDKYVDISMARASITSIWSFLLCAICGTLMVYTASTIICRQDIAASVLSFIGKHTRSIVCLHMISFKFVSVIMILASGMPLYMLASFPTIDKVPSWFWTVYTIVGVWLPLMGEGIYRRIKTVIRP